MADSAEGMKLAGVVQAWLDKMQLPVEMRLNEAGGTASVEAGCEIEGRQYRLFVEADEGRQWLSLYMYASVPIPADRYDEACKLVNAINLRFVSLGRLAAIHGKGFQFMALADVEGSTPSPTLIKNMLDAGTHVFKLWAGAMGDLIAGEKDASKVIEAVAKGEGAGAAAA
ncbi:MAG: hypothetical protein ACKVP9_19625 [Burkholderiales bacterium]